MKNWKQEIYRKRKLLLYGLIVLCLFFANYKLFFKPTVGSLMKNWPQVRELQRKVVVARNAVTNIPRHKRQIEELRSRLSLYKKKFSTQQQISSLLKGLSGMAKDTGVKIIAIKPHTVVTEQEDVSAGAYQKFPISIKASCGYHQLGSFLNELENAETFIRVTDIRITGGGFDNPMEHQVYILANTYILTETHNP